MTDRTLKKDFGAKFGISELLILALCIGALTLGYFYFKTSKELNLTKIDLDNTKTDLQNVQDQAKKLGEDLATEQYKNSLFGGQINEIVNTVGKLDQLAKTDKELLQKYSKVYFLNENYVPDSLADVPDDLIFEDDKKMQIHTKVLPFLKDMVRAAKSDDVNLQLISAYRSFGEQSSLKSSYLFTYGTGANRFSADQGYSEHQLGTAMDFTTSLLGNNYTSFDETKAYEWLQKNAYRYGFILSYPKGNYYYQFEPWHWRFVGRKLAERLHEENQNFYDLSQNSIDAYLINIFD